MKGLSAPIFNRRSGLQLIAACAAGQMPNCVTAASDQAHPKSDAKKPPQLPLRFPRDHGAHLQFQTEWWYITGYASSPSGQVSCGFQVTFFRSRVPAAQDLDSKLAAKHLLFAHAALSDLSSKSQYSDQRIARWSGLAAGTNPADQAWARLDDTGLLLRDWSLQREKDGRLRAQVQAKDFSLDLYFSPTQSELLQGQAGLSRKGPLAENFSYYYSQPHLAAEGRLRAKGKEFALGADSRAWLDHEWSDALLPRTAVGWDWIGINMFDGSALTAFQLRDKSGQAIWDGGSFRAGSTLYPFTRGEAVFQAQKWWQSPRSQARYPVQWLVRTPADFYTVKAVFEAQELDSRHSTGAIYWEGLCEVWDSKQRLVGRGYLEMTGYAAPLQL